MALLFQPIHFDQLQLSDGIIIAPMCQYSANEQGELRAIGTTGNGPIMHCLAQGCALLKRQLCSRKAASAMRIGTVERCAARADQSAARRK